MINDGFRVEGTRSKHKKKAVDLDSDREFGTLSAFLSLIIIFILLHAALALDFLLLMVILSVRFAIAVRVLF